MRWLKCFLLGASALGVLSCLLSDDDPDHIRLVWFGSDDEVRVLRESLAAFEAANPGHRVTLQLVEWGHFHEKVMTMLLGRRAPDAARMSVQWCRRYQALGALADIRPHVDPSDLEDFVPSRLASCVEGDQMFGLPHTTIGLMVFYNRDLFEEVGIEAPRTPEEAWTWEEFAQAAQTLQEQTGAAHGWGTYRGWFPVIPFLYQSGGHLLADGEPDFAAPANVEALTWFVDQHRHGPAPRTSWSTGGDSAETMFVRGDLVMVITGNWRLPLYEERIAEFAWDVMPLPRGVRRAANTGGENIAVFNTARAEAAARLVAFLTERGQMERYCSEATFLPARRSLLEGDLAQWPQGERLAMFARQSLDFEPEWAVEQSTPEFAAIETAFVRQIEMAVMGLRSPEESLAALNEEYRIAAFE